MYVSEGQYRSGEMTWSANLTRPVDLSFLKDALGDFDEPEITAFEMRITGSVQTPAGQTFSADDSARLLQEFRLSDKGGMRADFDGIGMRLAAQIELGNSLEEPATQPTSTTDAAYEVVLPLVWDVPKAERSRDTRPHVKEFLPENGGKLSIKMASGTPITGVTFSAGTYELIAHVVEGREREPGSRMCWLRSDVQNKDDRYDVGGSLRCAVMYATDDDNIGYETWAAATYPEIDSESLDLHDQLVHLLRTRYVRESHVASNDIIKAKTALPIVTPTRYQSIGKMPDLAQLHVKLPANPVANAQILICTITDRVLSNTAKILRVPASDVGKGGAAMVATPKGKKPLENVPGILQRRLPLRLSK